MHICIAVVVQLPYFHCEINIITIVTLEKVLLLHAYIVTSDFSFQSVHFAFGWLFITFTI